MLSHDFYIVICKNATYLVQMLEKQEGYGRTARNASMLPNIQNKTMGEKMDNEAENCVSLQLK